MSKIEAALETISKTEDSTERALLLAGLVSTLFKIKNVVVVLVGPLAYDCYAGTIHTSNELRLALHTGPWTPLMVQDIFAGQLRGEGLIWDWSVAGVPVRLTGEIFTSHKELCRDFQTDFGAVKLIPAEELIAERTLASFYPVENIRAKLEAKRLLSLGLVENIAIDWNALVTLCQSDAYRGAGEQLAELRTQAKKEVDELIAENEAARASDEAELLEEQAVAAEEAAGSAEEFAQPPVMPASPPEVPPKPDDPAPQDDEKK